jgi:predicted LPLAT superfamily acyltransferase
MKFEGYRILVRAANRLGPWVFNLAARTIAVGYFLLSRRTRESRRFYAVLFPQRSRLYHRWCTFRQYQNFTTIHLDRLLANQGRPVQFRVEGEDRLEAAIDGTGAILLMSHLGNWEMAARLLMQQRQDLRLLLYMGVKEKEGVERTQKEELRRAGVTVIGVDQGDSSPFAAVDGIRLLQAGGLVSMTGDVLWRRDQRRLPVTFCGRRAWVPEAPFVFALVSGAPIYAFFAFRTGAHRYRFVLPEPFAVRAASRAERGAAVAEAAQRYAALLEAALRAHPFEWYHFDRFIHEPVDRESPAG